MSDRGRDSQKLGRVRQLSWPTIEKAFAGEVSRFFLTHRLYQPHQDVERSIGEVERPAP